MGSKHSVRMRGSEKQFSGCHSVEMGSMFPKLGVASKARKGRAGCVRGRLLFEILGVIVAAVAVAVH